MIIIVSVVFIHLSGIEPRTGFMLKMFTFFWIFLLSSRHLKRTFSPEQNIRVNARMSILQFCLWPRWGGCCQSGQLCWETTLPASLDETFPPRGLQKRTLSLYVHCKWSTSLNKKCWHCSWNKTVSCYTTLYFALNSHSLLN